MQKPEVVNLDDEDEDIEIQYIPKEPMKEEEGMLDNPSQPKVFTLCGFTPYGKHYTAEVMEQERKTVIDNIKSLNGSYVDMDKWRDGITHVVYFDKHDKVGMTEKVMSAIAAGWWVVTKRYVEKSFKQGSWIPSLKMFT